ncbi:MAG: hypothetical protein RJB13_1933 [Pseudomonadota bacterium]
MTVQRLKTHFGKVRTNTALDPTHRILTSSNRISAFDCVLPFEVADKGTILQAISVFFFTRTKHIIPNHFIGCLDAQTMLVKTGLVFPLEIIARGTLSGSLWKCYAQGGAERVFSEWGVQLPDGMTQHQRLPETLITFTTKAATGHDELIRSDNVLSYIQNWIEQTKATDPRRADTLLTQIKSSASALFSFGQSHCESSGLLMLDTKYEFALDSSSNLMLVDEIHTPDSSRFISLEAYSQGRIEHFSKEWLREKVQGALAIQSAADREKAISLPFVLNPIWSNSSFQIELGQELNIRYKTLFEHFFPALKPWDVTAPHLVPWPLDPVAVRAAEVAQRLPSRVLVVGSGGRDFSLAKLFERQPDVDIVYCWPGRDSWNGGKFVSLTTMNEAELLSLCASQAVGLSVIGPEMPIARGLAEKLKEQGVPCLAPDLSGAQLEVSKIYAKEILNQAQCPTAESWTIGWNDLRTATSGSTSSNTAAVLQNFPYVIKYEALASGKGVCLVHNQADLQTAIDHFENNLPSWLKDLETVPVETYTRQKGEAQFLIEKLINGDEISAIALCHGTDFLLLPFARDFKRRNNLQKGPNTGGMGAVCPVIIPDALKPQIDSIFKRTLQTLASNNKPFHGFLFAGLMVDSNLNAQVLEFNCRLGDPETQVILPGLGRDFVLALWLTAQGKSWEANPWLSSQGDQKLLTHDGMKRCFVVVASPEYPETSAPVRKLLLPEKWPNDVQWIPSGVDSQLSTRAGRIAGVLGTGLSEQEVVEKTYAAMSLVGFEDSPNVLPHFRTDVRFPESQKN